MPYSTPIAHYTQTQTFFAVSESIAIRVKRSYCTRLDGLVTYDANTESFWDEKKGKQDTSVINPQIYSSPGFTFGRDCKTLRGGFTLGGGGFLFVVSNFFWVASMSP